MVGSSEQPYAPGVSFIDGVRAALSRYATFKGRARRSEYWWFNLFYVLVYLASGAVDARLGDSGAVIALALLGLFLPALAVSVRRLHDIGRSGWWVLISPIPFVGFVVMLAFTCEDSEPGTNEFGPSPKQPQEETPMGFGWESTQS